MVQFSSERKVGADSASEPSMLVGCEPSQSRDRRETRTQNARGPQQTVPASARIFLAIAASFGGLAVAIGAFGHHVLQGHLSERALDTLAIGARYQMYHALALLLVAVLLAATALPTKGLLAAGYAFIIGSALFSGSLYGLALGALGPLGFLTPVGGAALLAGWGCLLLVAWHPTRSL